MGPPGTVARARGRDPPESRGNAEGRAFPIESTPARPAMAGETGRRPGGGASSDQRGAPYAASRGRYAPARSGSPFAQGNAAERRSGVDPGQAARTGPRRPIDRAGGSPPGGRASALGDGGGEESPRCHRTVQSASSPGREGTRRSETSG